MLLRTKPFICWLAVEFQLTNLITDKKNECRIFQLVAHFTQFSHFIETKPLEIGTTKEKAFAKYSVFKEKLVYKAGFPDSQRPTFQKMYSQGIPKTVSAYIDGRHSYKLGFKPQLFTGSTVYEIQETQSSLSSLSVLMGHLNL